MFHPEQLSSMHLTSTSARVMALLTKDAVYAFTIKYSHHILHQ